jgi:cyclopropane-fatty-acyl-phospholipid synthase
MSLGIRLAEAGLVPDPILRAGIRVRHREVLRREDPGSAEARQESLRAFIRSMAQSPVATAPLDSNRQHYEVPPKLFEEMLGPRLKYSACLWQESELGRVPKPSEAEREIGLLAQAEEDTLSLMASRAGLADGMRILELGCGWGSFSLRAAEHYPASRIYAVSNSKDQGDFIRKRASDKGLKNIQALTVDMNQFAPPDGAGPFDRVVSVEMFEHMRNWQELLGRIAGWLTDDGRFFMHIFVHRELAYLFREGPDEWMTRHFFAGGMMPSDSLLLHLQSDLVVRDHWRMSGRHYARTLNSWLALLDSRRGKALEILARVHSQDGAKTQLNRWRIFLMACAELFDLKGGSEWLVAHYLLSKRRGS